MNSLKRHITKPLDILVYGVRQIRENRLSYRIDYQADDEFRPLCTAFNEMAAQQESMSGLKMKKTTVIAGITT
jgi:methyl-accepting chemotaxis protein